MIKKFIQRVLGGLSPSGRKAVARGEVLEKSKVSAGRAVRSKNAPSAALALVSEKSRAHPRSRVYTQAEHGVDRRDISDAALRTCEGLQDAGYEAFVVGGAVRDLLIGRHPKDFDVATSATPEQVRNVFRRSRIIGRRFRIVHVMFGQETIEVTTFRGAGGGAADEPAIEEPVENMAAAVSNTSSGVSTDESEAEEPQTRSRRRQRDRDFRRSNEKGPTSQADEHGRLLRDNVFGSQEEDAIRRDFTMNALFYDPSREEILDYVNGVPDIQKKCVVIIGDPVDRYREDPVRMLRAARLAGKLGFTIDPATEAPIAEMSALLANVPQARLFDEMLKLLLSGHALLCIEKLRSLGLHQQLLPAIDGLLRDEQSRPFVTLALRRTDERIAADKGVSPGFLFAALFWFPMLARQRELEDKGVRQLQAMHEAMDDVLDQQRKTLAIPRRLDPMVKELWLAQPKFLQRSQGKAHRTLSHPRFRACYDFFELRALAGDAPHDVATWWEAFQFADDDVRETMLQPDDEPKKKRSRNRKKKKPVVNDAPIASVQGELAIGDTDKTDDAHSTEKIHE